MKKNAIVFVCICSAVIVLFCSKDDDSKGLGKIENRDFRQDMRDFAQNISSYARGIHSDFEIIPQNGQEILTADGTSEGSPVTDYIKAISGVGREDLFYGYENDNEPTPSDENLRMLGLVNVAKNNGLKVMTIDYCSTKSYVDDSYAKNALNGFISFAADQRDLNNIPSYPSTPYNVNTLDVTNLSQAKNFLYLINSEKYGSKESFISAIKSTNYDVVLIDLFFDEEQFTASDIQSLKTKKDGGKRIVIAYMSIGEAENYRYYWEEGWEPGSPSFIYEENPDWEGNYKVKYWESGWQKIIYGNDESYVKKILVVGFDGVYLDIIDAFEYFEEIAEK